MIYAKLAAMCLGLVVFGSWTFVVPESPSKEITPKLKTRLSDVPQDVREKAYQLLERVMAEAEGLNDKEERWWLKLEVADLLWEKNELRARKLFRSLEPDPTNEWVVRYYFSVIEARDPKLAETIRREALASKRPCYQDANACGRNKTLGNTYVNNDSTNFDSPASNIIFSNSRPGNTDSVNTAAVYANTNVTNSNASPSNVANTWSESQSNVEAANDRLGALPQIPPKANETAEERSEREFINAVRLYSQITNFCNSASSAEQFVRLKNFRNYPDVIKIYGEDFYQALATAGMVEDLRPYFLKDKTIDRVRLLSIAAVALADRNETQGAQRLIAELAPLVPTRPRNQGQMVAMSAYALALSSFDREKAFLTASKIVDAADLLVGYPGEFSYSSVPYDKERNLFFHYSPYSIRIMRSLASSDFKRLEKLADLFDTPKTRVFFKWYLVNALLNNNAEAEEKGYTVEPCG